MKKYMYICGAVITTMLAFVGCLQPATTQVDIAGELNAELESSYVSSVPKTDEDNQNLVSLGSGMTVGGIIEEHEAQAEREEEAARTAVVNGAITAANTTIEEYISKVSAGDVEGIRAIITQQEEIARQAVTELVENDGTKEEGRLLYLTNIFETIRDEGYTVSEEYLEPIVEEEPVVETPSSTPSSTTPSSTPSSTTPSSTPSSTTPSSTPSSTTPSSTPSSTTPSSTPSSTTSSSKPSSTTSSSISSSTTSSSTQSSTTSSGDTSGNSSYTSSSTTSSKPATVYQNWQYTTNEVQEFPTFSINGELVTVGTGGYLNNNNTTSSSTSSNSSNNNWWYGGTGSSSSNTSSNTNWNYSTGETQAFPTFNINGQLVTPGTGGYLNNSNTTSSTPTNNNTSSNSNWWYGGTGSTSTPNTSTSSNANWNYSTGETQAFPTFSINGELITLGTGSYLNNSNTTSSNTTSSNTTNNTLSYNNWLYDGTGSNSTSSSTNSSAWNYSTGESQYFPTYSLTGEVITDPNNVLEGVIGSVNGFTTFIFPEGNTGYNSNYGSSSNNNLYNGTTYYIDYTGNGYNSYYTGTNTNTNANTNWNGGSIYIDYTGNGYTQAGFSGYNGSATTYINYTGTGYSLNNSSSTGDVQLNYQGPTNVLPNSSYDNYILIQPNNTNYTFSGGGTSAYTSSQYTLIPYNGSVDNVLNSLQFNYNDGASTGVTVNNGVIYIYPQYY